MRRTLLILLLALTALAPAAPVIAAAPTPSGLPVPRFVSLKFDVVNGRAGPSDQHPIVWTYRRKGLPMVVVAETENWRRVRDPDGEMVWMHRRTLDGRRTALVMEETVLLKRPEPGAPPVVIAEPGVVLQVRSCRDGWLRVVAGDRKGWVPPDALWGADCSDEDVGGLQSRLGF